MSIGISSNANPLSRNATLTRNVAIDRQNPYTVMLMRLTLVTTWQLDKAIVISNAISQHQSPETTEQDMSRPNNVLWIMCDQLRFDYLDCTGHPYPIVDSRTHQAASVPKRKKARRPSGHRAVAIPEQCCACRSRDARGSKATSWRQLLLHPLQTRLRRQAPRCARRHNRVSCATLPSC